MFIALIRGLNIIVLLGSDLYGGSQTPLQLLLKQEQDKNYLSNVVGQEIDLTRNMIEIAHSHSQERIPRPNIASPIQTVLLPLLFVSEIVCFDRDHAIIDYIKTRLLKFSQMSFNW